MKTLVDFFVKSIKNNAKHRHNKSLLGGFFNRKSLPAVRIGGEIMSSANKLSRRREHANKLQKGRLMKPYQDFLQKILGPQF